MIHQPERDEFAQIGLVADLRHLGAVVALLVTALAGMIVALLLMTQGFQAIQEYARWVGATLFPGAKPVVWSTIGFFASLAIYVKLCILPPKSKTTPGVRPAPDS